MNKKTSSRLEITVRFFLLFSLGICFIFPLFIMIVYSLKLPRESMAGFSNLLPGSPTFGNYYRAVTIIPYLLYMKNTFIIAFVSLLGQVVVCSMVAYSIAKIRWTLARPITVILFATMMLPYFTILIPLYKTWSSLGLTGTPWPLVLCNLFGNSFYIIIVRQFILGIPNSILEAAFVDGTSELQRYICIVLPLSKSALATVAILSFVANWSDYLNPMLYLVNKNDFTLSLGLYAFIGQHSVEWPLLMAAASIFVIPAIIIFILFQKQFIRGIAITGLK